MPRAESTDVATKLFAPLPEDLATAPNAAEKEILAAWNERATFETVQAARSGAPPFVFWEGPPTANGRPGIHHVLARTIKDAVCRFQTMQGRRVVRKAGWDTHGLPVELEVEKKLGISGKPQIEALAVDPATGKGGVERFNDECRKSVWTYKKEWEELSARIGYWLDYAHPYVTYEREYVDSIWYLLARMHAEGLVYRGKKVLPYCGRCGTGLSSHELGQPGVYRDVMDPSVTVRFRLADSVGAEPESFLAWTTTPWTLPSNFALVVHPDREYVRARVTLPVAKGAEAGSAGHEIVWVVRERARAVLGEKFEELGSAPGRDLVGRRYRPVFDDPIPAEEPGAWTPDGSRIHTVFPGDFVTVEDGTGIVHQAPYGADDWETARAHRLPLPMAVGRDGRFACPVGPVAAGTFFKEADGALMDDLKARHLLLKRAHEPHSYPHCWRCDTALFYFPTPAWFLRTTRLKERMLESNRRIRWVPAEVGEKRFGEWLENNVDWNISRDRYWGTPLPFWVCSNASCNHVVAVEGRRQLEEWTRSHPFSSAQRAEAAGLVDALPAEFDHHKPMIDRVGFACPNCAGVMRRTPAVLDCWFDSGAMPYAQYGWPHVEGSREMLRDQFPADFIAEGLDQTRGWFYTLHAIGAFVTALPDAGLPDGPAYRTCVVNGLVLDKDGVKMSKRLGNVVDPWKLIDEHGADALRWYLLSSGQPWLPKRFDPAGVLEGRRKFIGTLVHSYKFFAEYARVDAFDPHASSPSDGTGSGGDARTESTGGARIPAPAAGPEIDRWLLSRTQSLLRDVRAGMSDHDLAGVCGALETFVVDELSNWYIRRNRRRFWKSETGADKLAAFATLHAALSTVSLLCAPILPFLAEMLWQRLGPAHGSDLEAAGVRADGASAGIHGAASRSRPAGASTDAGRPRSLSVHERILPEVRTELIDPALEESMRIVTRIVEMGRALRERAGMKIRQPLRAIHVRSSHEPSLALLRATFATELVLGELNIKSWGSLAMDDGNLCRLRAKPNFRTLGKRVGGRMKAVAQRVETLPAESIARLRAGSDVSVEVDGETVVLAPDDVLIAVESRADFDVETDGRYVVFLDTRLDPELVAEGLAREVVNRINGLRKDAGLAVEDRIRVRVLEIEGPGLVDVLTSQRSLIQAETLSISLTSEGGAVGPGEAGPESFDLGEGRRMTIAITRA